MERQGDREIGKIGRQGDREIGRQGRQGDKEIGRWEIGRQGEGVLRVRSVCVRSLPSPPLVTCQHKWEGGANEATTSNGGRFNNLESELLLGNGFFAFIPLSLYFLLFFSFSSLSLFLSLFLSLSLSLSFPFTLSGLTFFLFPSF